MDLKLNINVSSFFSKAALFICAVVLLSTSLNLKKWRTTEQVIENDIVSYYSYLPATFIYHDLKLDFMKNPPPGYRGIFWPGHAPNGGRIIKMSMGMSLMYLPFFTIGHLVAGIRGQIQDGYSSSYYFFLIMGTIFYVMLGLFVLRKILLRFFSDNITALTLLSVFIGTNLLYYSTTEPLMSHAYEFTVNILLLYFILAWHETPSWKNSLKVGFIAGVLILVRPSNIISLAIFFLYGVYSFQTFKEKWRLLLSQWVKVALIGVCIVAVFFPQLLYWKWNSGQWWYYSYGHEKFYFSSPHILDGLFSYRKGWLVYTPIMCFAIAGLFLAKKFSKNFLAALPVYLLLNIWIITSWWCWWYGGSFGNRAFIDSYGLLAIPLAGCYTFLMNNSKVKTVVLLIIVFLLMALQVFQTFQYRYQAIHYDSMTKAAYWKSFLKIRPPQGFYELLKEPDIENAIKGLEEK